MTHFLVEYAERGNTAAREQHRAEHISYRKQLGARLPLAGPLLDEAGKPTGSVVILEAGDRAEAERVASADPYVGHGVLELVSVRAFRIAAMKPPASVP
jgi:uncharacterized protein YciI